jgi:hypothetical protein
LEIALAGLRGELAHGLTGEGPVIGTDNGIAYTSRAFRARLSGRWRGCLEIQHDEVLRGDRNTCRQLHD